MSQNPFNRGKGSRRTLTRHALRIRNLERRPVPVTRTLNAIVDGAGSVIVTGVAGDMFIDFDCTIKKAALFADQDGDVEVDVWATDAAHFPPDDTDSICGSPPDFPTLSSAHSSVDTTLTNWTKFIAAGTTLRFNINSVDTITRLCIALTLQPS